MFHEVSNGSMWFHMILCGFTLVCMVLHGLAWFHVVSRVRVEPTVGRSRVGEVGTGNV